MLGLLIVALFAATAAVSVLVLADSALRARNVWGALRREAAELARYEDQMFASTRLVTCNATANVTVRRHSGNAARSAHPRSISVRAGLRAAA
ncbi:MAG: hypothetical protein IE933_07140 [Sphingomonadales bacterium]|nr:hypothetical protein [Sphingomonadales bacterium]MBD3772475.1 hypothetical protein [Paracoccaceae bacterium]